MNVEVGYKAALAAVGILNTAPALTTITKFYAELSDPSSADGTVANTRRRPCVVCHFENAVEFPMFTGNFSGFLVVEVEMYDDDHTAAQKAAILSDVFSRFSTDTILADLSAATTGFTAIGFTGGIQQSPLAVADAQAGKRLLSKSIILPINCCAKTLT